MPEAEALASATEAVTGAAADTQGGSSDSGAATGTQEAAKGASGKSGSQDTGETETAPVAPEWPDDWRDRFLKKAPATDREKLQKRLNRFASPDNVLSSFLELERKQSAGLLKKALPENASPEELADYRKAHGIPAEATPEAYGIAFPEGYEPTDADKADIGDFLGSMHAENAPPGTVKKVWDTYLGIKAKAEQQLYDAAQDATVNRRAEIRAEYGRDFDRNMRLGNQFLVDRLGEEKAKGIAAMTLADGTKLGDHPDFVRLFVGAALDNADDASLVTAELGGGSGTIDEKITEAHALQSTDYKKYWSEEHQAKLQKLYQAKAKRAA